MKIVISALAVLVLLAAVPLIEKRPVFAASSHHPRAAYRSGFEHGVTDGTSNGSWYISQPRQGFAWHLSEFVKGYINGYCSIPANKNVGTDNDRAAFYCPDGS